MSTLYGRRYRLTLTAGTQRTSWTGLDLQFRVSKTITADPNELELTLFGLSESSKNLMHSPGAAVLLEAGYEQEFGTIFSGHIGDVQDDGAMPEIPTIIRASDGAHAVRQTPMAISISAGVSPQEAIQQVLKVTGLQAAASVASATKTLTRGLSLVGAPSTILDSITQAQGLSWSIQDGELHVLPPSGSGVVVVVEEPIGKLTRRTEKGKVLVSFRSLLRAAIRPGVLVHVKSAGVQVVAQTVEHTGELPGQSWYTDVEGLLR